MEHNAFESAPARAAAEPGLLQSIWRHRWMVVAIALLAAVAAYGVSYLQTPTYEARARLLLTDPASTGLFEEGSRVDPERFLANQVEVANSSDVHARAAESLGAEYTEQDVGGDVEVSGSEGVDVLTIEAEGDSAQEAAALANAVGQAYADLRREDIQQRAEQSVEQLSDSMTDLRERIDEANAALGGEGTDSLLEAERDAAADQLASFEARADEIAVDAALYGSGVERFTEARPPLAPTAPRPARNAAVGLMLGVVAGAGIAWLRTERKRSADSRQDPAEILQAPLLAQVPKFKSVGVSGFDPARSSPHSAAAESYQFLVSTVEYALARVGGKSVVVTSPTTAAGKTLTAFNLAIAGVRSGRRVVLCDGDERTRGLTALTGTAPAPGLTDLADEQIPVEGAMAMIDVPPSRGLSFVPAGTRPSELAEFFRTTGFRTALRRVSERGDLVIVDAPPLLAVSDTSLIASQVDGILLVVPQGTPLRTLQEARERLDFVGTPLLGYVFNKSDASGPRHVYGYRRDGSSRVSAPERVGADGDHANGNGRRRPAGRR